MTPSPQDIPAFIRKLPKNCGDESLFEEILTTLLLMGGIEHNDRGDYKLINQALKELRSSFKIFKPYREIREVALFSSVRVVESDLNYELAKSLVENGFMINSGAGGGIMKAANRGAFVDNSFGLNIKLPHEQATNSFIYDSANLM
jgi:hypothetical protein|tara:strand:+ start:35 stop:472 length:438 start_codon:yes stop_codon:yes gene_type:complete